MKRFPDDYVKYLNCQVFEISFSLFIVRSNIFKVILKIHQIVLLQIKNNTSASHSKKKIRFFFLLVKYLKK